jgi:hypothetical protein
VKANSLPQSRATDQADCAGGGAPDFVVTGSGTVLVNGLPAARQYDRTMHPPPGMILVGSSNVNIGGPTVGVTLGNPAAGRRACRQAAKGRTSGSTKQSARNCGVESTRQLINQATGANVTEDDLLDQSMQSGDASEARQRTKSGGTRPRGLIRILARNGVPASLQDATMQKILQGIAEGRGVITPHDTSILWGPSQEGGHAIVVTGVEFDANGKPVTIIANDTGTGVCSARYPAARFERSLLPGYPVAITGGRIW